MNTRLIAVAAGSASLGIIVGWGSASFFYKKKLQEKDDYIDVVREMSRRMPVATMDAINETVAGISANFHFLTQPEEDVETPDPNQMELEFESENSPGGDDDENSDEEVNEEKLETNRRDLQEIIDQYTNNPEDRDAFVQKGRRAVGDARPPFVISKAKYAWDEEEGDEYDKVTYTYYPSHRVVLDEDEEVVDEVDYVLGWRNLRRFGDESDDPDVVFIRNQKMLTDFEVVRDEDHDIPLYVKYGKGKLPARTRS
jgi:hypothetical protein